MKKRMVLIFLALSLLSGCVGKKAASEPVACVPKEDCFLCGREAYFWRQNNIGLVSLNTFDLLPMEINRYDNDGELIEKLTGTFRVRNHKNGEDGLRISTIEEADRGYALVDVTLGEDRVTDRKKAAAFLCEDCLEQILPEGEEVPSGLAAVDLLSKEIQAFDEHTRSFVLGDYFIHCDWEKNGKAVHLVLCYSPLRYEEEE